MKHLWNFAKALVIFSSLIGFWGCWKHWSWAKYVAKRLVRGVALWILCSISYSCFQVDISKVTMLCVLMESLVFQKGANPDPKMDTVKLHQLMSAVFVFSYVWSIGGNLVESCQDVFDSLVRELFQDNTDIRVIRFIENQKAALHCFHSSQFLVCYILIFNIFFQISFFLCFILATRFRRHVWLLRWFRHKKIRALGTNCPTFQVSCWGNETYLLISMRLPRGFPKLFPKLFRNKQGIWAKTKKNGICMLAKIDSEDRILLLKLNVRFES